MEKNILFAKTAAGREALATRSAGLRPRLRALLIMVDGKRNLAELDTLTGADGSAATALAELAASGWIEEVGVDGWPKASAPVSVLAVGAAVGSPQESRPAPLESTRSNAALPFSDARRQVVRFINDQLGPLGESLAIRAEACKTPADLQAELPRIRDVLKSSVGAAAVQHFNEELADRLPKV